MSKPNSNAKKLVLCAALFLLAGLLRIADKNCAPPVSALLFLATNFLYIGLIIAWGISIKQRILQSNARMLLVGICTLMVLWMLLRACKYRYFDSIDSALRYMWYGYYIPQLFGSVLGLLAALCLGHSDTYRPPKAWYLLFLPSLALCALILTNDLHQLAFRFQPDFLDWNDTYAHGPVYYLSMIWMIGLIALTVCVLIRKCKRPSDKRRVWIPAALFLAGFTLCILNFVDVFKFYQLPELFSATYAVTWEACIQIGLVSSNTNYRDFFHASDIAAQITDADGNVRYRARGARPLRKEEMSLARNGVVMLNADTRLHGHPIHGGHVYWQNNIAEINHMKEELAETRALLEEEAEITQAENELKAQRARVEEQSRLYDTISLLVRPQLTKLDALLINLEPNAPEYHQQLKLACVLGAYVKRLCNLRLIAENATAMSSKELYYCLRESLEYLSAGGVPGECVQEGDGAASSASILLSYDFFQAALEAALPTLSSLLVRSGVRNGVLTLRLVMEDAAGVLSSDWRRGELGRLSGAFDVERQDGTLFYTLCLPEGGDAA